MSIFNNIVTAAFAVMSLALVGCKSQNATTTYSEKQDEASLVVKASSVESKLNAEIASMNKMLPAAGLGKAVISAKIRALTNEKNFYHTYPREIKILRDQIRARNLRKAPTTDMMVTLLATEQNFENLFPIYFAAPAKELDEAIQAKNDLLDSDIKGRSKSDNKALQGALKTVKNSEANVEKLLSFKTEYTRELVASRAVIAKGVSKVKSTVATVQGTVDSTIATATTSLKNLSKGVQVRIAQIQDKVNYDTVLPQKIMQLTWDLEDEITAKPDMQPSVIANLIGLNLKDARSDYKKLAEKFIAAEEAVLTDYRTQLSELQGCYTECHVDSEDQINMLENQLIPAQVEKIKKMKDFLDFMTDVKSKFIRKSV